MIKLNRGFPIFIPTQEHGNEKNLKPSTGNRQPSTVVINCWRTIGVWGRGKQRCSRLEEVIHCRNCEVFIQAGRDLLERDIPQKYRDQCRNMLAAQQEGEDLLGGVAVVIFRIEAEWFALEAGLFEEIINARKIHSLPHNKSTAFMGIVNVHGNIQLCASLKELLGLTTKEEGGPKKQQAHKLMMVVNCEGNLWVFPADEIHG
ncbi:MAG: hypothetical protein GY852_11025, partial [bacterium]|nr:hypothetical protein [bacterium]